MEHIRRAGAIVAVLVWVTGGPLFAETAGWRGDGTGKYPQADPPITWSRVSRAVSGLRYQAGKPADANPAGRPMADGVVREWLILGPVPFPKDNKIEAEALPNEAQFSPEEGDKAGPCVWKKLTTDTAYVDFGAAMGKSEEAVAFACTRIHSETGGSFRLNITSTANVRLFVNGKPAANLGGRMKLELARGWNCIVLKVLPGEKDWYVVPVLHAWGPAACEAANIAWRTALPGVGQAFYGGGQGVAAPLIIGERIYVHSEPFDLICLRQADGKVLWLRRHSHYEAADEQERKQPEFKEAEAVAARLDAINAAFVAGAATAAQLQEKDTLEKSLQKEMRRAAPRKYGLSTPPDVGFSGLTPTTDGQFIYAASESGVSVCYDLDGNHRWIRLDRRKGVEHGFSSSPLLVDGKLVVFMRDLMAFDATTGAAAWSTPLVELEGMNPGGFFHGSPVAARIGGLPVIALSNGMLIRAANGKPLNKALDTGPSPVASPAVEGDTVFVAGTNSTLLMSRLPQVLADPVQATTRKVPIDTSAFPKHYLNWHLASPLVHDGLAYLVNNAGVLSVVDVRTAEVVYQKMLDLDVFQAHNEGASRGVGISPALAGGHLYFFGNNGAAVVIEPGRAYKQIAKNKIESTAAAGHWSERQERFMANPVFDGQRLYLRSEAALWAIGGERLEK